VTLQQHPSRRSSSWLCSAILDDGAQKKFAGKRSLLFLDTAFNTLNFATRAAFVDGWLIAAQFDVVFT